MKRMLSVMAGITTIALMGGAAYALMDKKKQKQIDKMLNNAASEANKMMNKVTK